MFKLLHTVAAAFDGIHFWAKLFYTIGITTLIVCLSSAFFLLRGSALLHWILGALLTYAFSGLLLVFAFTFILDLAYKEKARKER